MVQKSNEGIYFISTPIFMWEFPIAKVKENESLFDAIEREINEELNYYIKALEVFNDNTHDYDNFLVNLIAIKLTLFCRIYNL